MNKNPAVNRYLRDKDIDRIDHALGRPTFPMSETYRNYFATDASGDLAISFGYSPYWEWFARLGDMDFFSVTEIGRRKLADHLETLEEPWIGFAVTYLGHTTIVPAKSRGRARYLLFLDISDSRPDLTFSEFCRATSVRRLAS